MVKQKIWFKSNWNHFSSHPNRFKPKKILGPKSLVNIGSVTAEILLIWTNVTRTNVVWPNVTVTVDIS